MYRRFQNRRTVRAEFASIQEGRYLEIYSLVQDGIIEPELGAKRLNMTFADFERAMQKAGYKL